MVMVVGSIPILDWTRNRTTSPVGRIRYRNEAWEIAEEDRMSESFCVIEAPGPHYLAVRKVIKHEFYWVKEYHKALQFCSFIQTEDFKEAIRQFLPDLFSFEKTLGNAKVVRGFTTKASTNEFDV